MTEVPSKAAYTGNAASAGAPREAWLPATNRRVAAALALHREHLTATPSSPGGTPYRCECVGCQMARLLLGEDE